MKLHLISQDKLSFSKAILWIFVSTLLISGSAFMGWLYYLHMKELRYRDEQYNIVAIVQDTSSNESMKTVVLAEILQISLDKPTNLYEFDTKHAVNQLLECPVIKKAVVKKILPGTLYIQYEMRTPIAYVGDFLNALIDDEGIIFPSHPFYSTKRLPIFYLGLEETVQWGDSIKKNPALQMALKIKDIFNYSLNSNYRIKQLDLMEYNADSYGKKQIVLVVEEYFERQKGPLYVRLNAENFEQGMLYFQTLLFSFFNKQGMSRERNRETVIDLRIPQLAFLSL